MIRVTAAYPNVAGKRFDHAYYAEQHVALCRRMMGALLVRVEVEKGLSSFAPGSRPPFVAFGHLYFRTMEDVHQALAAMAGENDIPNFTDIEPQFQIGEIVIS